MAYTWLTNTVEIVFTDDLPNGPYLEVTGGGVSSNFFLPGGLVYRDVQTTFLAAWIRARPQGAFGETWKLKSLMYKGGVVNPDARASAGSHTANLTCSQSCCTIL